MITITKMPPMLLISTSDKRASGSVFPELFVYLGLIAGGVMD